MNNPKILAIIPARGGSVGIPGKNIIDLGGKPLIAYSIETALKSKFITKTVCTTDDPGIREVAIKYGAQAPFLRPSELAQNNTPILPVLQHTVQYIEKTDFKPDIIILLQPTSPFRTVKQIDKAIEIFIKTNCDSVVSLCKAQENPHWMRKIQSGKVKYLIERGANDFSQRQKLPTYYRLTGAIYVFGYNTLIHEKKIDGPDIRSLIVSQEQSIDIDTNWDLTLARFLLDRKKHHSTEEAL